MATATGGTLVLADVAGNECTNYVATWKSTAFGCPGPGYLLGNAGQWARQRGRHGVTGSTGARPWARSPNGRPQPTAWPEGHVAVVEAVGPRGHYIIVFQQHLLAPCANGYDWTGSMPGARPKHWQPWPSHFIHFPHRDLR